MSRGATFFKTELKVVAEKKMTKFGLDSYLKKLTKNATESYAMIQ